MDQWKSHECAFILTCCGCVPIIGAIKAAVLAGPVIVIFTTGATLINILLIPHDIFLTYYTLVRTDTIGPNLKVLGFLLLPIPLVMSIPLTLLGSLLFSIGLGLLYPLFITFKNYCEGCQALVLSFTFLGDFWDMHYHGYFNYLSELRTPHKDAPWDINICQVIFGLVIATIGSIFVGISVSILSVLKFVPGLFRGWYEMIKFFWFDHTEIFLWCACFPVWFIVLFVWPAVAVILFAICGLGGFTVGAWSAVIAYQDGILAGFQSMYVYVHEFDEKSNKLIGFGGSCLPEIEPVVHRKPPLVNAVQVIDEPRRRVSIVSMANPQAAKDTTPRIPTSQIWDLFFEMVPIHVKDVLADGLLKKEELAVIEINRLPQRIAALVYFGVLDRSSSLAAIVSQALREVVGLGPDRMVLEYTGGIHVLALSNGVNLDESNRPLDPLANSLFPAAVSASHSLALARTAPSHTLTDAHITYIKQLILARSTSDPPPPPITFSETEIRTCNSVAQTCLTSGTRAALTPTYLRRLRFALRNFASESGKVIADASDVV